MNTALENTLLITLTKHLTKIHENTYIHHNSVRLSTTPATGISIYLDRLDKTTIIIEQYDAMCQIGNDTCTIIKKLNQIHLSNPALLTDLTNTCQQALKGTLRPHTSEISLTLSGKKVPCQLSIKSTS